ncbi:MAG: energy-coupling factor ABC transporter ATP-binding protein [Oscillospiraceae bacterium]|jgi:energy-coupling factor transporter ATP-binding protein EcfA2|nr:energy-coupling factor ABC transporter ATP-binding protein [Oscillospiraceae bacterium]
MIKVSDFTFCYDGSAQNTLQNVNFNIKPGEFIGLTGNSGSGKTTLLYALCGVIPHFVKGDFYGSIKINGLDTIDTPPAELARHIGLVMQDTESLFATTVVEDEIRFGLENFGFANIEEHITQTLQLLEIEHLRHEFLKSLSGGQKRRVAIAAVLALQPQCLLLDEPTGELDPPGKRMVYEILTKLNKSGVTIIAAEKNVELLNEFCKKTFSVEDGYVKI